MTEDVGTGRHARSPRMVSVVINDRDLADYGVEPGDCVIVDRDQVPSDGELGMIISLQGIIVASIFYQGDYGDSNYLLVTSGNGYVLTAEDQPELVGKVTDLQRRLQLLPR